jgi:hypothetical protein
MTSMRPAYEAVKKAVVDVGRVLNDSKIPG